VSFTDELSAAGSAIAIAAAAYGMSKAGIAYYRRTLGSRRQLRGRLDSIACGVTTGYVDGLFGAPAFARDLPHDPMFRERIYCTQSAWLSTWSTDDDAIHVLSVTVTDMRFAFPVTNLTIDQLTVTLGRSVFADVSEPPAGQRLSLDGRRTEYAEYFYFGNAGYNQHYILSYNDAGYGAPDVVSATSVGEFADGMLPSHADEDPALTVDKRPALETFRRRTRINTLTIGAPHLPISTLARDWTGIDADHVRALRVWPAR
jgi:hypothetical protein